MELYFTTRRVPIQRIGDVKGQGCVIEARVTFKSPIYFKEEIPYFSIHLLDETGETRAAIVRDNVDRFFGEINEKGVYFFENFNIVRASKKYFTLEHNYEIEFISNTMVTNSERDNFPTLVYDFQPLAIVEETEVDEPIGFIIGVVETVSHLQVIQVYKCSHKREITIVDDSGTSVNVTLWDRQAEQFPTDQHPVIAIRNGEVKTFMDEKYLSVLQNSALWINPDIDEAHRLRNWFDGFTSEQGF